MARYTIELRKLIQMGFNPFDDSWTTFVPEHKNELCDKIIAKYNFCEIGSETPDRFKFYINEHLRRIMPYYNQLYMSETLKLEPLYNMLYSTESDRTRDTGKERFTFNRRDVEQLRRIATDLKRLYDETFANKGSQDIKDSKTWEEHTTGDKDVNGSDKYDETKDTSQDVTTSGSKNGTEVTEDTISGTTDGTSHTDKSGSEINKYSETPQAKISTSAMQIEQSYLTDYRNISTSSDENTTTHQTTESTENKNVTTDETTSGSENTVGKITTDGSSTTGENTTYSEDKNGSENGTRETADKQDGTKEGTATEFSAQTNNEKSNEISAENEEVKEDEKEKHVVWYKGSSVSQSDLLMKFRETFLNIDDMIIAELANNFMGVF